MKKLEYIHSPEHLIRESIHYRLFNVFQFEYVVDKLKTKKSIQKDEVVDFQEKLLEAKRLNKRRVFRKGVVLEMDIYINQRNAPSIQNIPKCYIDLLWRPAERYKNKKLILKDDDQIKYLKVNYRKSITENSSLQIQIFSYQRLLKDIELLFRLKTGIFKYDLKSIELYENEEDEEDKYKENDNFDDLINHLREKESYVKQFGEDDFKFWEYFYKRHVQEVQLNNQRIKNNQILNLYRKSIKIDNILNHLRNSDLSNFNFHSLEGLWNRLFDVLGDFNIGNLPTKSGDQEIFKKKLTKKVDDYFKKHWYYFPLLNPIALSIFIQLPKNSSKDFDNIAKWILPLYIKKLNPPTSFDNSLQEIEKYRMKEYRDQPSFFPRHGEFPKIGVMSYQIIQIPRSEDSPENGYIKVNLHNVYFYRPFVEYTINQISKYEDRLE